jgi:hypothetical protein
MEPDEKPAAEETESKNEERPVDLNLLYPGADCDLNRLFPDQGTKKLLQDLKRNKRDLERFIRTLETEED